MSERLKVKTSSLGDCCSASTVGCFLMTGFSLIQALILPSKALLIPLPRDETADVVIFPPVYKEGRYLPVSLDAPHGGSVDAKIQNFGNASVSL